jgi:hypothetical protein
MRAYLNIIYSEIKRERERRVKRDDDGDDETGRQRLEDRILFLLLSICMHVDILNFFLLNVP